MSGKLLNNKRGFTQHHFHQMTISMLKIFCSKNKTKNKLRLSNESGAGFTMVEILVSLGSFSIVFLTIISFVLWANFYNAKTTADGEVAENARRILDLIAYEVRGATSIYTPTSTSDQLSLETTRYLPTGETITFIDFFLCGSSLCLKKESQSPITIHADSVEISDLSFSQILNASTPSVKIDLTVSYKNQHSTTGNYASASLTSTASLRAY